MNHSEIFELLLAADPVQTIATGEERLMPLREFICVSLSRKIHEVDASDNVSKESIAWSMASAWKASAPKEWREVSKRYNTIRKGFEKRQRDRGLPTRKPKKKTRTVDLPPKKVIPKSSGNLNAEQTARRKKPRRKGSTQNDALDNDFGLGETRSIRMAKGLRRGERLKLPYTNCPWCGESISEDERRAHQANQIAHQRCSAQQSTG